MAEGGEGEDGEGGRGRREVGRRKRERGKRDGQGKAWQGYEGLEDGVSLAGAMSVLVFFRRGKTERPERRGITATSESAKPYRQQTTDKQATGTPKKEGRTVTS